MAFRLSDADSIPRDRAYTVRGYTLVHTAGGYHFSRHLDPEAKPARLPEDMRVAFDAEGRPFLQQRLL